MSPGRQTVRDLVEEAKKRILLLSICVVGLSYLMSLTSSSVWVNLPAAASLIFILRYISLDLETRRRAAAYNSKAPTYNHVLKKSQEGPKVATREKSSWRRKVNSPVVEVAIDQFTKHLVSEWVIDLWYSRLTPDKDGPDELVQIINTVFGELSYRAREINLIDLLTRDVVSLISTHLELSRTTQAKIEKQKSGDFTIDQRDAELKLVLAAENKLHPALFSAQAEHKVLQHLMDGLMSFTFRPADLQCSFFRIIVRELLACAVIRPVLNLASPKFINERIELLVISSKHKADKGFSPAAKEALRHKPNGSSRTSSDHFSGPSDPSVTGVELVQLKHDSPKNALDGSMNGTIDQKDPLLAVDPRSSCSWSSLPSPPSLATEGENIKRHQSGGEWGEMLDIISHRKSRALAPEHFENMWTKGRNYKKKEGASESIKQNAKNRSSGSVDHLKAPFKHDRKYESCKIDFPKKNSTPENLRIHINKSNLDHPPVTFYPEEKEHDVISLEEIESNSDSGSSHTTEDDESSNVTGLDSPGVKVWDSKNKRNAAVSRIRHPLESSGHLAKKNAKGRADYHRRSRLNSEKIPEWKEVERTSFLLGDGQDILNASKEDAKAEESSDDPELESWGRGHSGATASSSTLFMSANDVCSPSGNFLENSALTNSFLKLRCEVLGANIVKSGSKTFAVYSISVTDADNNVWSIKRRFRHFEELHRRLKDFTEYNLSLPPKHFLSSGLDVAVVQERCKLLDNYLKNLLRLPTISRSIEVWDFLSVDSQSYTFSNSFSIVQTLSVDLDDKPYEKSTKIQDVGSPVKDALLSRKEQSGPNGKGVVLQMKPNFVADTSRLKTENTEESSVKNPGKECRNLDEDSESDSDKKWIPPNLSVPILDLVDVLLQLQDGGWIRRQAFWIAKQVLQLGMGDAFDDWLIEKIQLLRQGSVISSAIKRLEQILWPDGIFITKHPRRQRPPQSPMQSPSSQHETMQISSPNKVDGKLNGNNSLTDEQQEEEDARRAKFVYELMIDNAPAALVSLVGRKEYERSAKDLYFFLQSSVCLKQFAFNLLELLLTSAFPELDDVIKQLHEEKQKPTSQVPGSQCMKKLVGKLLILEQAQNLQALIPRLSHKSLPKEVAEQ